MPREQRGPVERKLAKAIRERLREHYLKGPDALSQRELAERLQLTFQTVNAWFRNPPAMPDVATLHKIARLANWNLNYLLLGEGEPLRGPVPVPIDESALLRRHAEAEILRYLTWRREREPDAVRQLEADLKTGLLPSGRWGDRSPPG